MNKLNKPSHIKIARMIDNITYRTCFVLGVISLLLEIVSNWQG